MAHSIKFSSFNTYVGFFDMGNLSALGKEKSCFDGELLMGLIEA
jgi:hypothetical protein